MNGLGIIFYLMCTCLLALYMLKKHTSIQDTLAYTGTSAAVLAVLTFYIGMMGIVTIEKEWELGEYKVEYRVERGFSGGALKTYQLYQYAALPILLKHVDELTDNDTTRTCIIKFTYKDLKFNKCRQLDGLSPKIIILQY